MYDNIQVMSRKNLSVSVTPEAKAVVDKLSHETGMKVTRIVSAVYLWFAEQDDVTQKTVLGLLPRGHEADIAKVILRRLAEAGTVKPHGLAHEDAPSASAKPESPPGAASTPAAPPKSRRPVAGR